MSERAMAGGESPFVFCLFSLIFAKPASLVLDLVKLTLSGKFHAAFLDKSNDRWQFVRIEPDAVFLANIDDHA